MQVMIFDCESTGLPVNWKAPMHDVDNWPRCIQLAWIVSDINQVEISRGYHLIKPENWTMPTGDFWKDHGFTHDKSLAEGKPIKDVLEMFIADLNHCSFLISHNMSFDHNVLGAEMIRVRIRAAVRPEKICTKELSVDLCKIPFGNDQRPWKNKEYKWPKLSELYQFLFQKDFELAHDALGDVIACMECFFEMVKRGVIKLPEEVPV